MSGRKTASPAAHRPQSPRLALVRPRPWRWAAALTSGLALGLLLGACPGEGTSRKQDWGIDGWSADGAAGDLWNPDLGSQPDMTYGELSCLDLMSCIAGCENDTCVDYCLLEGTAAAQQQIVELVECTSDARTITCSLKCEGDERSAECYACVDETCAEELHVCLFGDVTLTGFGQLCDASQTPCPEPLVCASIASVEQGFCTYPCTRGELCQGAPLGTYAGCILSGEGGDLCGFVCGRNGKQYACPDQLVCSPTEQQPDSGLYFCIEPS